MSDAGPLSPEQKEQVALATAALKRLLRPARVARVNAWTIAIFGVLTILWGLVAGGGLVVGAALLAVAWNEFRGVRMLNALDPEGGKVLGWNQLILGAVIAVYCGFAIVRARTAPDASMAELEQMMGYSSDVVAELTALVYGAVGILVAIVQVFLARWHFRAGQRIEAFRRDTPAWVLELVRG